MSPMDIAKALTIIEKNNFDSIKISHIIQKFSLLHATQLLNDIQPAASEPETILQCINHFNDVSNWVTSEILLRVGKEKEQCLKKFIQIAKACYQIGNFNSMMEVISGINHSSISRLKLLDNIEDTIKEEFKNLEKVMETTKNFKNYHDEINIRKENKQTLLPFFGLILRDITFSLENKPYLTNGEVNFQFISLVGKLIYSIIEFQCKTTLISIEINEKTDIILDFLKNHLKNRIDYKKLEDDTQIII